MKRVGRFISLPLLRSHMLGLSAGDIEASAVNSLNERFRILHHKVDPGSKVNQ